MPEYGEVLGLDISMCSTGVARLYSRGGQAEIRTTAIKSKGTRKDSLKDRARRIRDIKERALSWHNGLLSLVVIESPSFGSSGAGTWDRAGLWWEIVNNLVGRDVPIATISPLSLKRFYAGTGKADKTAMMDAHEKLWGARTKTSDESDAAALATAGAVWLGLDGLPDLRNQLLDSLDKAAWPEGL